MARGSLHKQAGYICADQSSTPKILLAIGRRTIHFPHPRRRRDNYKTCRATPIISLVQNPGRPPGPTDSDEEAEILAEIKQDEETEEVDEALLAS